MNEEREDTGLDSYRLIMDGAKKDWEVKVSKRDVNPFVEKTQEESLDIVSEIKNQPMITPKQILDLQNSKQFLLSTYTDVPQYRPMVVKLASVLDDGRLATADSKFWQCKKEAEVHFQELVSGVYKWRIGQIDLNEMEYKIASLERLLEEGVIRSDLDPQLIKFDLERLKVKKERYEFNIKLLEKNIKYRIEEVTDWAAIAKSLEKDCKYSTTNAQEHDLEGFSRRLEFEIENASDEQTKQKYKSQLNTLRRLMLEKVKNLAKEREA